MIKKTVCNTHPAFHPSSVGEVMDMDIIFGPEVSIRNIRYGLLFTDRFSRITYLYPLHNLTTDIPKQIEAFFAHIGIIPKCLVTDFDMVSKQENILTVYWFILMQLLLSSQEWFS